MQTVDGELQIPHTVSKCVTNRMKVALYKAVTNIVKLIISSAAWDKSPTVEQIFWVFQMDLLELMIIINSALQVDLHSFT